MTESPFTEPGKVGTGRAAPAIHVDLVLNMEGLAAGHHLGSVSGWQGDHQQLRDALADILEAAARRVRAGGELAC